MATPVREEGFSLFPPQADLPLPTRLALRDSLPIIDRAVERLTSGWKRQALRAAWFLMDAVIRGDAGGLRQAFHILEQEV